MGLYDCDVRSDSPAAARLSPFTSLVPRLRVNGPYWHYLEGSLRVMLTRWALTMYTSLIIPGVDELRSRSLKFCCLFSIINLRQDVASKTPRVWWNRRGTLSPCAPRYIYIDRQNANNDCRDPRLFAKGPWKYCRNPTKTYLGLRVDHRAIFKAP